MSALARAVLGLSLASAGVDVWLAASPQRGWGLLELGVLFAIGFAGTVPLLLPALSVEHRWRGRGAGVAVALLAVLHLAVWWRFGPWINAPLRATPVWGGWLLGTAIIGVVGWRLGPLLSVAPLGVLGALVGGLGLLGAGAAVSPTPASTPPQGPSVLLVTLDTTRPDRLPPAPGARVEAPVLAGLVERGTTFTQAIAAAPLTGPSHLSLLTGRYPTTTGIVANGTPIGERPDALAPRLQAHGYRTAGFVAGYPVHARFGFGQGFDTFDSDFSPVPGLHELAWVGALDALVVRNTPRERRGDWVVARFRAWLERAPPTPFFAWVHFYDPHGPYRAPEPFASRFVDEPAVGGEPLELPFFWPADQRAITDEDYLVAQYDSELAWTDHLLGQVLAALEQRGRLDDTLIVVTADHGESLTEHDILFDHGDDLYDPALRVPLVIAGPGVRPGQRVGCQTPTVDVAPTLLDWLSVADGVERDGTSLVDVLRGGACEDRPAFATTLGARTPRPPIDHALREPDAKFILREGRESSFFELTADPGELHSDLGRARAGDLRAVLEERVAEAALEVGEVTGQDRTLLEQLGYLEP